MPKIRILSLDGGGARAGIHARVLGSLYGSKTPGREILRKFDYVAGNSGGSLVIAALCCNYTPCEIDAMYDNPATLRWMFSPRWVNCVPLLRCFLPRYSMKGKFESLKIVLDRKRQDGEDAPSTIPIEAWPTLVGHSIRILITAFDYDRERAAFFRSDPDSLAKSSGPIVKAKLVEAVHASTNAPILYYDKPAECCGRRYWDGAMAGYNNPVFAAVTEALANQPSRAAEMRVLSIGTGTSAQADSDEADPPMGIKIDGAGFFGSLKKAAVVIFRDPPDIATFHAHVALDQPLPADKITTCNGNVVRLSPMVAPIPVTNGQNKWRIPSGLSKLEFANLMSSSQDELKPATIALSRKMCDLWFNDEIRNQPIRTGRDLRCDIGHDRYSEATAWWRQISD
jgi:uncharacterized protein